LTVYTDFWYYAPTQLLTGDTVEMELHLNHVSGWQQFWCIVPKTVYTIKSASEDGLICHPEQVGLI
jgi:hypothetical protein